MIVNKEEKIEILAEELMEGWEETAKQVDKALMSIPEDANSILVFSALTERAAMVAMYFDMDEKEFGNFAKAAYRSAVKNIRKEEVH
jgi:hypothetical protein